MNSRILTAVVVLTTCLPASADELGDAVRAAVGKVAESTLRIRTVGSSAEQGGISSQVTTGISLSTDGYVLSSTFGFPSTTAAVFVEDADGQRVAAKLVARDSLRQLVLLKCETGRFVVPALSEKRWPEIGAYAIAAGRLYPGETPSISVGVVSAVNRVFGMALQTDAKISPVNYGGPLIGLNGEVLGILVPLSPRATGDGLAAGVEWYDSGIGFAIPAPDLLDAAKQLRDGKDRVRGVMGINLTTPNPLSPIVQVGEVLPGSPADKAGVKVADFIARANDTDTNRVGLFNSVIKSSYAGDVLNLKLKRGEQEINASVELTDKLQRPEKAYLGLVLKAQDEKATTTNKGAEALVLPEGPTAELTSAKRLVISEVNGEKVKTSNGLAAALLRVTPEQSVKLTIAERTDDEAAKPREVSVKATSRPDSLAEINADDVASFVNSEPLTNWKQSEEDFKEEGKAWVYAPDASDDSVFGMVILVSDATTDNDQVLKEWSDVCQQRGLVLVVPRNVEKTALSAEDEGLIQKAIAAVSVKYSVSTRRRILVTEAAQAALTTQLLLETQGEVAGGAVYRESWPQTSAYPEELLSAAAAQVLLIEGKAISRQQQALYQQSVRELRDAKSWLVIERASEDGPDSALIADWFLQQQSF